MTRISSPAEAVDGCSLASSLSQHSREVPLKLRPESPRDMPPIYTDENWLQQSHHDICVGKADMQSDDKKLS